MSKPVKHMIRRELTRRLEGVTSLAVVDLSGIDANTTNHIRGRLIDKQIRLSVVRNSFAKQAFEDVGLASAASLLAGPCALAYGGDNIVSIVRELRDIAKEVTALGLKGALLEGDLFGPERMEELSRYPTRNEAMGQILSAALSPGRRLAAGALAPGAGIASLLKAIEEKGHEEEAAASGEGAAEAKASADADSPEQGDAQEENKDAAETE